MEELDGEMEDIDLEDFSLVNDGDEVRTIKNGKTVRWHGRIRVIYMMGKDWYIGPHWLFSIVLFVFMIGFTGFYGFLAMNILTWYYTIPGILLILLTFYVFIQLLASDPGVLRKSSYESASAYQGMEQLFTSNGGRECSICDIIQPAEALHCEYCHVCVDGYDHHCPWTSKCIGSKNLREFQLFLFFGFGTLFYVMFAVIMAARNLGK